MNDFTKYELQIILLDMDAYILNSKPLNESLIHYELRKKIQSMIKNYHECVFDMQEYCTGCVRYKKHE